MAVKIRLARRGKTHKAFYNIVAADARAPRDGKKIAKLGTYDPHHQPASVRLDREAIVGWLLKGAQPTETVRNILSSQGVLLQKHLAVGVRKGDITQETADSRFDEWKKKAAKKKKIDFIEIVDLHHTGQKADQEATQASSS